MFSSSIVRYFVRSAVVVAPATAPALAHLDRCERCMNELESTVLAIVAFVVWRISKIFMKEESPAEVKDCPFCMEPNAVGATKCRACASAI